LSFRQSEENLFNAISMGISIWIGHGIDDQHDVVAMIVRVPRGRFYATGGGDSGEKDLRHSAPAQGKFKERWGRGLVGCWGVEYQKVMVARSPRTAAFAACTPALGLR
jgi:hypothetical protein